MGVVRMGLTEYTMFTIDFGLYRSQQSLLVMSLQARGCLRATAATAVAHLSHRSSVCLSLCPSHG